ncbi:prepilin-type N-terminal cleavage/methylation domain-containing protein [Gallibacterium genomosp. 1]|uniref:prepilin-type N-terminal cleavage/methylation domain-containing protein n=1 Tax=Gallibacterium genomosp. 1 TaxID=155515 RepID=UPI0008025FD0|nr:prepilin-type N-terminal cleavage/methylation domain-containing protein [Gallibacterium genomosp. 1]OBX02300.1 N-terminal cleavage protein [Gallibacterium genomosp. 1]
MSKYQPGFTLIELLVVIFIFSFSLLWVAPDWRNIQQQFLLYVEQNRLQRYLALVQQRINHSLESWQLIGNKSAHNWCLIAQPKSVAICNCLYLQGCEKHQERLVYMPYSPGRVTFIAKDYYPKELTTFKPERNTMKKKCFLLQAGQQRILFKYSGIGEVRINENISESACLQYED